MENKKTLRNYLFTPFRYIAGVKSLIYGGIVLLLLSGLSYQTQTVFDGVLDIHYGCWTDPDSYLILLACLLISWISIVLVLYFAARIFSPSTIRLVDIAGTTALAKFPLIFAALWGFFPFVHLCLDETMTLSSLNELVAYRIGELTLTFLVLIPFVAWNLVLTYNAFSVSANLKGKKGILLFIIGIIVGEIISKALIYGMILIMK